MSKRFNQFIGKAGHLHIMAEFLMRGWNVAIPEVDMGDGFGNLSGNKLVYRFSYNLDGSSVSSAGIDFSSNINNFEDFPIVPH